MWIFLNDSFLSVVAHQSRPDDLLVRARAPYDIERLVPGAQVTKTIEADYRFRATVPRAVFARLLSEYASKIDYYNFKDSVSDPKRAGLYLSVWRDMLPMQPGSGLPPYRSFDDG